jgi:hypothetical protein
MKTTLEMTVAATAAALLGACASGGGNDESVDALKCLVAGPFCPLVLADRQADAAPASASPALTPPPTFTGWSASGPGQFLEVAGVAGVVTYETSGEAAHSVSEPVSIAQDQYSSVRFDAQRNLESIQVNGYAPAARTRPSPFDGIPNSLPNPLAMGWEYQSFGVWDHSNEFARMLVATSFGAATPGSAVPLSGTASFTGKLSGLHVSPDGRGASAAADLTMSANFSTRSLSFASRGTTLTPAGSAAASAPHLDLGGTLTYAPGTNRFSGTLANAGGTISGASTGRFYGPAAQELGGVFTLRAPATVETFVGAYGAKR